MESDKQKPYNYDTFNIIGMYAICINLPLCRQILAWIYVNTNI